MDWRGHFPKLITMSSILRWYKRLVDKYPYRTQMMTAGLLSTSGDLIAQNITKERSSSYDLKRTAIMGCLGFSWVAPFSITWFRYLRTLNLSVMKNVLVDQLFGFTTCYAGFLYLHSLMHNHGDIVVAHKIVKEKYASVITQGWMVWIPVQTINFLVVPFFLRILYIQSVSLLWQTYLSFLTNRNSTWC